MRQYLTKPLIALSVFALGLAAPEMFAARQDSNYRNIPERNIFGLKPAPQPQPTQNPEPDLQRLILTGISTILDRKCVLMKAIPPARPGEQVKELSLMLFEGQREGNVEVRNIDENAGAVRVINAGREMTLTFERDGAKLPTTPGAVPPGPGVPPTAANALTPTGVPAPGTNPALAMAAQPLHAPTRALNLPAYNPALSNTVPGTATAIYPGAQSTAAQLPVPPNAAASRPLTADEQAALLLIEREANNRTTNAAPALPPGASATPPPPPPVIPGPPAILPQ